MSIVSEDDDEDDGEDAYTCFVHTSKNTQKRTTINAGSYHIFAAWEKKCRKMERKSDSVIEREEERW